MGWFEDQTWLRPSMSKSNKLSKKRQGPSTRKSEKTKKLLFRPAECQETSFNLIAFIQTFSRKLIHMPLMVKIFWPELKSDNIRITVFESKWKNGKEWWCSSLKKAQRAGNLVVLRWIQFFISWHFDIYLCLLQGIQWLICTQGHTVLSGLW